MWIRPGEVGCAGCFGLLQWYRSRGEAALCWVECVVGQARDGACRSDGLGGRFASGAFALKEASMPQAEKRHGEAPDPLPGTAVKCLNRVSVACEAERAVAGGAGQDPWVVVDHPPWCAPWGKRGVQRSVSLPERGEEQSFDFARSEVGRVREVGEVSPAEVVQEAERQTGGQARSALRCQASADGDLAGCRAQSVGESQDESGEGLVGQGIKAAGQRPLVVHFSAPAACGGRWGRSTAARGDRGPKERRRPGEIPGAFPILALTPGCICADR